MKFEMALSVIEGENSMRDEVIVVLGLEKGVYVGKFVEGAVSFFDKLKFDQAFEVLKKQFDLGNIIAFEFDENGLIPKPGFPGVLYRPCGIITVTSLKRKKRLIIEYLDTTKGTIPLHKHQPWEREIYFSCEEKFEGRVCDYNQQHQPFAEHTFAVKMQNV